MISVDIKLLAKALAAELLNEALERLRRDAARQAPTAIQLVELTGELIRNSPEYTTSAVPRTLDMIDKDSAETLGLSPSQFKRLARQGAFPTFRLDNTGTRKAHRHDVIAWIESRRAVPDATDSTIAVPRKLVLSPPQVDLDPLVAEKMTEPAQSIHLRAGRNRKGTGGH